MELNKILNDKSSLKKIDGGHSGSALYQIQNNSDLYCMKIFNNSDYNSKVIRTICDIYKTLKIPSLNVIEESENDNTEKYIIYNFIDGLDLKTLSKNMTETEIYKYGFILGDYLKKLRNYSDKNISMIPKVNINKLTSHVNELYKLLIQNPVVKSLFEEYFTLEKIEKLIKMHNEYKSLFYEKDLHLIHGDIKMSNTMIGKNGTFYLVDIESMKFSYDVLNFRYQIVWKLMKGNKKELIFTKGMLDSLYDSKRPNNFYEQLIYVLVLNFIEHTYHVSNDEKKLRNFFQNIKGVLTNQINEKIREFI